LIMQDQQFQTIIDRLAARKGLSAKQAGAIVDVPIDVAAIEEYVRVFYNYLVTVYDEAAGITPTITEDEFTIVIMCSLAKRVQWVRQRVNGLREGQTIQISNTTVLPGPIYTMMYMFGKVESREGAIFLPEFVGFDRYLGLLTIDVMRNYLQFASKLKHYYAFSEGMPSQDRGTFGYLLVANVTPLGSFVTGPTSEATPNDAYLAAVVRAARVISGFFYGTVYGVIQNPEIARIEFFDAYGKGIGDGK